MCWNMQQCRKLNFLPRLYGAFGRIEILILWQQVTENNRNVVERAKHLLEEWRNAIIRSSCRDLHS